jgi:plastocyanin
MPAPIAGAWSALLAALDKIVSPDWSDPIHWLPLLFSALLVVALALMSARWWSMAAINRPRVPRPLRAGAPPPGVHLPGPSPWPFVLPIGLALGLFSLAIHPADQHANLPLLAIGLAVTLAALAGWIRDAMRDWQRVERLTASGPQPLPGAHGHAALAGQASAVAALPSGTWVLPRPARPTAPSAEGGSSAADDAAAAASPAAPAPHSTHLPAPSPWPFFLPIGAFFVLFGLVMNATIMLGGLAMTLIALAGWFRDAGREFRQIDAGHAPEPRFRDPERAFPKGLVVVYALLAVASIVGAAAPSLIASLNARPPAAQASAAAAVGAAPLSSELHVVAQGIRFDQATLTAPAGQPLTIVFENRDAVPHNIAIFDSPSMAKRLFSGALVTGPATATYAVPALPAGTYYFHCDVHPNMNGTLVVK